MHSKSLSVKQRQLPLVDWADLPRYCCLCDESLNLQWLAFGRVADQGDGFLRAVGDAHPAAHASGGIDAGESVIHRNRRKLAHLGALAAAGAQPFVHYRHVPGRRDHGRAAIALRLHRPAAARAAYPSTLGQLQMA
jgi:hypothetical protein